jgi:CheY-like chemotaxis protein
MMTKLLKKRDDHLTIATSYDGLDAINKVCNNINLYDLLLIDNTMPNLSGAMATKLLRGIGYNKLIIGITGNNSEYDINEFNKTGLDYIFIKPFNSEKLELLFNFLDNYGYSRIPNKKISMVSEDKLEWT